MMRREFIKRLVGAAVPSLRRRDAIAGEMDDVREGRKVGFRGQNGWGAGILCASCRMPPISPRVLLSHDQFRVPAGRRVHISTFARQPVKAILRLTDAPQLLRITQGRMRLSFPRNANS
jgi:hypothetical protein